MFRWLIRRKLAAFERTYQYDMSYIREMLEIDPQAVMLFSRVQALSNFRKDVPRDVLFAASVVGAVAEDCGPCTQLGVRMAEHDGVPPEVIRAVLERDFAAMPADVALACRFAEAALAHSAEADGLRDQVVERWGKRALLSLCFGMTMARFYPTLKYALGHGKACVRVTVGGKSVNVAHQPQVVG